MTCLCAFQNYPTVPLEKHKLSLSFLSTLLINISKPPIVKVIVLFSNVLEVKFNICQNIIVLYGFTNAQCFL